MNILYKVTYLPHLNTGFPKYYIGSKYNYTGNYFGSVASKQVFEYTEGASLSEWWKNRNTFDFQFDIISEHSNVTPGELIELEYNLHLELDVLSSDYFNQSVATRGFFSKEKSSVTRVQMSESGKAFYETSKGMAKRQRLSERNRRTKSDEMKAKWENPTEAMLARTYPRKSNAKTFKYKDKIFQTVEEESITTGVKMSTIRYRCSVNYKDEWCYV